MPDAAFPELAAEDAVHLTPFLQDPHAQVTWLAVDWRESLLRLESLGEVRIITRNRAMIHDKTGRFANVSVAGPAMLVLNQSIDLRVFPQHWRHTLLRVDGDGGQVLHVFDGHGRPVIAIHRTAATDGQAWDAFAASARSGSDEPPRLDPEPQRQAERPDEEIDADGLRAAWDALRDVHEFHGMLKRFDVGRVQALRLVAGTWTRRLEADAPVRILHAAVARQLNIMVFVGNPGNIQIHTGPIATADLEGGHLRVRDPGFGLNCDLSRIREVWEVRKPTAEGGITTLELYDDRGDNAAILCGQRDPDKPERAEWRSAMSEL